LAAGYEHVPFWASWIAVIVAGALSLVGFRAAMHG